MVSPHPKTSLFKCVFSSCFFFANVPKLLWASAVHRSVREGAFPEPPIVRIAIKCLPSAPVCRDLIKKILGQPIDAAFILIGAHLLTIEKPRADDFKL